MKCQRLLIIAVSSLCSMNACSQSQESNVISIEKADSIPSVAEIPSGAKALSATYPDFIKGYSNGSLPETANMQYECMFAVSGIERHIH